MTEQEWLTCDKPSSLAWYLSRISGYTLKSHYERRCRLFSVESCKIIWNDMVNERDRDAVLAAELYADGLMDDETFAAHHLNAGNNLGGYDRKDPRRHASLAAYHITTPRGSGKVMMMGMTLGYNACFGQAERIIQADIIREIFGNPFKIHKCKFTKLAAVAATAIYNQKTFDELPMLADMLEDSGCNDNEVLEHCRKESRHVRGCWVLDLIMERQEYRMSLSVKPIAVGNRYWWLTKTFKGPAVLEIVKIDGDKYTISICDYRGYCEPSEVEWTSEEWNHEVTNDKLNDELLPVTAADCAANEEVCPTCNGTRWERTRDSDVVNCIWCSFSGKREKIPEQKPTKARRSPLHPELPIKE